jgi:hypothetical protein
MRRLSEWAVGEWAVGRAKASTAHPSSTASLPTAHCALPTFFADIWSTEL